MNTIPLINADTEKTLAKEATRRGFTFERVSRDEFEHTKTRARMADLDKLKIAERSGDPEILRQTRERLQTKNSFADAVTILDWEPNWKSGSETL